MAQKRERFQMTTDERTTIKKLEMLTQAVDRIYPSPWFLLWRSFLSGLFAALGGTIGLAIILALSTFILSQLKYTPFINSVIQNTHMEKILPQTK